MSYALYASDEFVRFCSTEKREKERKTRINEYKKREQQHAVYIFEILMTWWTMKIAKVEKKHSEIEYVPLLPSSVAQKLIKIAST